MELHKTVQKVLYPILLLRYHSEAHSFEVFAFTGEAKIFSYLLAIEEEDVIPPDDDDDCYTTR